MNLAAKLCLTASGIFFMTGLLTGVWKYLAIAASPTHQAHRYISTAHQAALAYAFACLVLARFAEFSPYPMGFTAGAAGLAIVHFAFAIVAYVVHGIFQTTDNQFRPPHQLGRLRLGSMSVKALMWSLAISEIAGSGVLFWGFLQTQVWGG